MAKTVDKDLSKFVVRTSKSKEAGPKGFQKGNSLWKSRASSGRNRIFNNAQELWNTAVKYFEWIESNPLVETKTYCHKGEKPKTIKVDKMRPMSIKHFCFHIGINEATWYTYRKRDIFKDVAWCIEGIIHTWNLHGASAGFLDPGVITRLLALKEHHDHSSEDGTMKPQTNIFDLSNWETEDLLKLESIVEKYASESDSESDTEPE